MRYTTDGYSVVICNVCHRILCIERNNFREHWLCGFSNDIYNFHKHWNREGHPKYHETTAEELWRHVQI